MSIISFEQIGCERWDAFCASSKNAWFRHTSTFIEFARTLAKGSENLSFAVVNTSENIIALFPLVMQTTERGKEFAMGGTPTPFPVFAGDSTHEERVKALNLGMDEIDRRAKKQSVTRTKIFVDSLTEPITSGQMQENPFLHFGYRDTSIETTCVDLRQTEENLYVNISPSHRANIRKAEDAGYVVDFFESDQEENSFSIFEQIYFAAAGVKAGTPARWRATAGLMRKGFAMPALIRKKDSSQYVAGNMYMIYKQRAYYMLSATLPEYQKTRGLGHLLQWETMKFLKQKDFTHYEVGWIVPRESSQKEKDISHFKSLFGGKRFPVFSGEKNY